MSEKLHARHHHEHDNHCSHGHDHKIQGWVARKIRNNTTKMILGTVLRFGGLAICPGDDIATAALAAFNNNPDHHELQAVFPPQLVLERDVVIIDRRRRPVSGIVSSPLKEPQNVVSFHRTVDARKRNDLRRNHVRAMAEQNNPWAVRYIQENPHEFIEDKPESKKHKKTKSRLRKAVAAVTTIGILGGGLLVGLKANMPKSETRTATPAVTLQDPNIHEEVRPHAIKEKPRQQTTLERRAVQSGDTIWDLQKAIFQETGCKATDTTIMDQFSTIRQNNPEIADLDRIYPGQTIVFSTQSATCN